MQSTRCPPLSGKGKTTLKSDEDAYIAEGVSSPVPWIRGRLDGDAGMEKAMTKKKSAWNYERLDAGANSNEAPSVKQSYLASVILLR